MHEANLETYRHNDGDGNQPLALLELSDNRALVNALLRAMCTSWNVTMSEGGALAYWAANDE